MTSTVHITPQTRDPTLTSTIRYQKTFGGLPQRLADLGTLLLIWWRSVSKTRQTAAGER